MCRHGLPSFTPSSSCLSVWSRYRCYCLRTASDVQLHDTLAGIGTGLAMRNARTLSAAQQEGVFLVVKDWPGLALPFALGILGTGGWVIAVGSLALAARRQAAPRREWVVLGLAAIFLLGGHPFPWGTLAFGCFFLAALFHEWNASRAVVARSPSPS